MIHQYQLGGYNIVLDVCSGSVHVVDEAAYDMIAMFEDKEKEIVLQEMKEKYAGHEDVTPQDLEECYEQIAALKDSGKLFAPDHFEPMAGRLKEKTAGVVKALCLHIAHTCNLNCSYCFASQGKYHGDRAVMSFEVGKQALDFLVANSGSRKNLEVDFFGGEPLMNFDVVRELVAYARSIEKEHNKKFRFTLTTNGLLIDDDVIEFANQEMSNVVLSLDGRKEIHDRFRVDYAGIGSFEQIVPKFQKLVAARGGKNYYMRGTFTHANPDFLEDIKQMLALGFTELSMEPVVCAPGDPSELTEEDLPVVLSQYEKLAELMLEREKEGKPFTFYHYMIDLGHGPCIYKRIAGIEDETECSDMREELTDRFGDIPRPVENLLRISLLRKQAHDLFLSDVQGKNEVLTFTFAGHADVRAERIPALLQDFGGRMAFYAKGAYLQHRYKKCGVVEKDGEMLLTLTESILERMRQYLL